MLAAKVLPRLLAADGARASLNDLAEAAAVSVPTLRHYFGDRSGVVAAALSSAEALGAEHVETMAIPSSNDLADSLRDVAKRVWLAWSLFGVERFFAGGLAVAIYDQHAGPAFVRGILEPLQQAIERRLRVHALRGEADIAIDLERTAALSFASPLLVALLHQGPLFGDRCRPLDISAFSEQHVIRFVRAWGPR